MSLAASRARLALMPLVAACLNQFSVSPALAATPPPPLSQDAAPADIASTYGSNVFGRWQVDRFGLPAYDYTIDQQTDPRAQQPELAGKTDAWSQVGNDRVVASAYNHGHVQVWSQDRVAQWLNRYDAQNQHFSGGYGYLNVDGQALSTLYDDRPAGASTDRLFGVGYYATRLATAGVAVDSTVYAPFGDDPLLLHDVSLRNTTSHPEKVTWFEYWDVNPFHQGLHQQRGIDAPAWDAAGQTLSVGQQSYDGDNSPLSIFASQLQGHTESYDTSTTAFFGSGTRSQPQAVLQGHLSDSIAAPAGNYSVGKTLFAMASPLHLAPGATATLRYAYGYSHPAAIAPMVARYRVARDPFAASEGAWQAALPRASFGPGYQWVARELTWDAYLLRSATVYEEACGHHTITQGGYYQYDDGANLGFRSWLHYLLPITYMDPYLAREILLYATGLQPPGGAAAAQFPYGMVDLCSRFDLGTSGDLDFWLLLAAAEYGLASRDAGFFDTPVNFYDASQQATMWDHLKIAFQHMESLRGPHGGYSPESTGDWSDFSVEFMHMTESMLITAQLAYAYPQLAQLADLRGDVAFAAQLRAAGGADLATMRREWTGRGWYSRGYSGATQIGQGAIWLEPQPWAVLAGAPTAAQAATLTANIRRFLDGVGAPAAVRGPDRIGTALSPARTDPDVTEFTTPQEGEGDNNAVWVGGTWFDPNGWLTWAYSSLDGVLPDARQRAWDEYLRNTLANHATVYPGHWDGTTSLDDTCWAFYSSHPDYCGLVLNDTNYEGQITEQPTWMVMDAVRLAGITPTADGYLVAPHLPLGGFSLRMPRVGVAVEPGRMRGYIVPVAGSSLQMTVRLPAGVDAAGATVWVQGRVAAAETTGAGLRFTLPTTAGAAADWAVTWSSAPQASPASSLPNTSPKLPLVAVLVVTGMMVLLTRRTLSVRRRRG